MNPSGEILNGLDQAFVEEMLRTAIPVGQQAVVASTYKGYLAQADYEAIAPARRTIEVHLKQLLSERIAESAEKPFTRLGFKTVAPRLMPAGPIDVAVVSDYEHKVPPGKVQVIASFPRDMHRIQGSETVSLTGQEETPSGASPGETVKIDRRDQRAEVEIVDSAGRRCRVPVGASEVRIGRGDAKDGVSVTLANETISRVHLGLRLVDRRWQICDLSTNGTAIRWFFGLLRRTIPPKRWIPVPKGSLKLVLADSVPITIRLR